MVESEWSIFIFLKNFKIQFAWPTFPEKVMICDNDYINKPES
jgi:hypothetical protein